MRITTKQLTQTALLLAICIASQFLKNVSVYVTGSIVNITLVLAALAVGFYGGLFIAIISPITSTIIAGGLTATLPILIPIIMLGNVILVLTISLFNKKCSFRGSLPVSLAIGSILKALFLGVAVVLFALPVFGTALPDPVKAKASMVFTVVQLPTAIIGSFLAYIIWIPLKKYLSHEE